MDMHVTAAEKLYISRNFHEPTAEEAAAEENRLFLIVQAQTQAKELDETLAALEAIGCAGFTVPIIRNGKPDRSGYDFEDIRETLTDFNVEGAKFDEVQG